MTAELRRTGLFDAPEICLRIYRTIARKQFKGLPFTRQIEALDGTIKEFRAGDRGSVRLWQLAREAILSGDVADAFPRARGSRLDSIYSIIASGQTFDVRATALGVDTVRRAAAER